MDSEQSRELTYGERSVGKNFNPSQNLQVDEIKTLCARLLDMVQEFPPTDELAIELKIEAKAALRAAQMAAVKVVTYGA